MPRRALLGNWYEEEAYAADHKRLMQGRSGGSVDARHEVARVRAKLSHHNTPVTLARATASTTKTTTTTTTTTSDTNWVSSVTATARTAAAAVLAGHEADAAPLRFYAPVQLRNARTCGVLSVDLDDRQRTATGWQVLVSTDSNSDTAGAAAATAMTTRMSDTTRTNTADTAPPPAATLRNTVVLVPAAAAPVDSMPVPRDEEDVVHYGQPFYIMTLPALCAQALSLLSEARSPSSASNVTASLQRVFFSPDGGTAGALWCVDYVDADYRDDMRDRPVRADAVVLLRHHMTAALLASVREAVYYNDFGPQYEVGCGRLTEYASKRKGGPYRCENYWSFVHDDDDVDDDNGGGGADKPLSPS